jgi:hypothetical protein
MMKNKSRASQKPARPPRTPTERTTYAAADRSEEQLRALMREAEKLHGRIVAFSSRRGMAVLAE